MKLFLQDIKNLARILQEKAVAEIIILKSQGKTSCKILDTLQEKGHFPSKILASCKFFTRFLLLAKNCARNVMFLAHFLQEKGTYSVHVQCIKHTRTCKILIFPARFDKNLARKLSCNFFLQDSCKISYILQEKLHFKYIQDLQDLMQDLASLSRKILARLAYFL